MKQRQEWTEWATKRLARLDTDRSFDVEMASAQRQQALAVKPVPAKHANALYPLILLCGEHSLPAPIPEYKFHPVRGWRFDYAFVMQKIGIEIDGAVWTEGRHTRGGGFIEDQRKHNAAAKLGWRVLRYTPDRLGEAVEDLKDMLK